MLVEGNFIEVAEYYHAYKGPKVSLNVFHIRLHRFRKTGKRVSFKYLRDALTKRKIKTEDYKSAPPAEGWKGIGLFCEEAMVYGDGHSTHTGRGDI